MDALDSLLDGPRARGAFLLRALLDPPWSLHVQDEAPLTVVAMLRGEAWLLGGASGDLPGGRDPADRPIGMSPSAVVPHATPDRSSAAAAGPRATPGRQSTAATAGPRATSGRPSAAAAGPDATSGRSSAAAAGSPATPGRQSTAATVGPHATPGGPSAAAAGLHATTAARLTAGEVAIMRGPDHYTLADSPDRPTTAVVLPGGRATTIDGQQLCDEMALGVRTWGNSATGATGMLIGTYEVSSEVSQRLLRALPAMLILSDEARDCPLLPLLAAEVGRDAPGQEVVLDRMLDLLVIDLLRRWFAGPDSTAPAWYHADSDPIVGPALRLMHNNPAHPWTVAELARHAGVSRAALAKRFTGLVGEPPMSYLSSWRLTLAADLIRQPDHTLHAVARKVGYSSAFALSTAFKRVRGMSPHDYRAQVG